MKKSRFTVEQIIKILRQHETGIKVGEICREHGISDQTFYNWKSKYGGMTIPEIRRLKGLEAENQQLKRLVADQALSIRALQEVIGKKL